MNDLRFTLTTDGSSDRVLLRHLEWILRRELGPHVAIQPQWADLRSLRKGPDNLAEKVRLSLELYPCDLLFVHRDAEASDPLPRYSEIERAVTVAGISKPFVPIVPVRMTEAWLLFDERAIRRAAGNPNGCMPLDLLSKDPESIIDPKTVLHDTLKKASGLKGRRLRNFRSNEAVHRVAEYIDDFTPLQDLNAFQTLRKQIVAELKSWSERTSS
jgi:hypothetical protein